MFKYQWLNIMILSLFFLTVSFFMADYASKKAVNNFMSRSAIIIIPMKDADYFRENIPAIGDVMPH